MRRSDFSPSKAVRLQDVFSFNPRIGPDSIRQGDASHLGFAILQRAPLCNSASIRVPRMVQKHLSKAKYALAVTVLAGKNSRLHLHFAESPVLAIRPESWWR